MKMNYCQNKSILRQACAFCSKYQTINSAGRKINHTLHYESALFCDIIGLQIFGILNRSHLTQQVTEFYGVAVKGGV